MVELLTLIALMCQVNTSVSTADTVMQAQRKCHREWMSCVYKYTGKVAVSQVLMDCSSEVLREK